MDNNLNQEILDKLTKVCVCKAVSRATIKNTIRDGAKSVEEIAKKTGATTGGCCGRRCICKIETLIKESN
ncbi:(2Fe-2S)-binding protein [Clostridium tarantellae]|uniref:(2Fe-2S)-binding protein n=1 Tax=Clostridium tarantellae TaxID=39493 RepID=A0A6I1MT99_9CLOT|nr:(2Fe-2S)-binding protein [Clostridium tarantellae]MPQ43459.1 (2Fe-2S)-binding protein [Clostridium tarantellae]